MKKIVELKRLLEVCAEDSSRKERARSRCIHEYRKFSEGKSNWEKVTKMKSMTMDVSFYNRLVELIEDENNEIKILSGEGDYGDFEVYTGKRTMRAIKMRLTIERCGGDRWARALVFSHTYHDPAGYREDIYYNLETGDAVSLPHED